MCITDKEETRTFYVKSNDKEIRLGNGTSNIINELIKFFLSNYQKEEQILRNGRNYIFESVGILCIHFHNIKLKRRSSCMDSPRWIKNKKATINPKKIKDNKCFQYSLTVTLHHLEINNHSERISNIKPHNDKHNWKDINFPAGIKDWKKFERNNKDIALNILSTPSKEKRNIICKSKYNRKRKNEVVLLMITNNEQEDTKEKWYYIALKSEITDDEYKKPLSSLSRLSREITSNNNGDFYCLRCLHSFRTDNALKKHERVCNNHDYCGIVMPAEDKNILKYKSGKKIIKSSEHNLHGP